MENRRMTAREWAGWLAVEAIVGWNWIRYLVTRPTYAAELRAALVESDTDRRGVRVLLGGEKAARQFAASEGERLRAALADAEGEGLKSAQALAEAESEIAALREELDTARGSIASERVEITRLKSALGDRHNASGRLIGEAERLAEDAESDLSEAETLRAEARASESAMAETVSRLAELARESYPALNVGRVLADTVRRADGTVAFTGGPRRIPSEVVTTTTTEAERVKAIRERYRKAGRPLPPGEAEKLAASWAKREAKREARPLPPGVAPPKRRRPRELSPALARGSGGGALRPPGEGKDAPTPRRRGGRTIAIRRDPPPEDS